MKSANTTNNIILCNQELINIINKNAVPEKELLSAHGSLHNLYNRIKKESINNNDFISIDERWNLGIGSFFKKTQIKPLNDIDIMISLNSMNYDITNGAIDFFDHTTTFKIKEKSNLFVKKIPTLLDSDGFLNSRKVIESFKKTLNNSLFSRSKIHRRQEVVVVDLISYNWCFDVVPCFYVGQDEYLIPNGQGNWKLTAPKKDKDRLTLSIIKNSERVLDVIKLFKILIKKEGLENTFNSYLLETMILDYYDKNITESLLFFDFMAILKYISKNIYKIVWDSKCIDGNINDLNFKDQQKIDAAFSSKYFAFYLAILNRNIADFNFIFNEKTP